MSTAKRFANVVKPGRATALGACLTLLTVICLTAAPAQAQQNRTWVSGTGDNASATCSRAAPCATFANALGKTNAGGEINCLDSGSFGALIITKSISVICEGVVGGMLQAGSDVIALLTGAADVVVLRGLDIDGVAGIGAGVNFLSGGGALHIENCRIRDGSGTGSWGIKFTPTFAAELYVTDTTVSHNGTTGGGGILVQAPAGSTSKAVITNSNVQNNFFGIKADGTGAGGGVINMTIRATASVGNSSNGIVGTMSAGGAAVVMMLDRVTSSHNAAGFGIIADGPSTFIHVGGSSIAGNANGVGASNGGTLLSFKTNQIRGNSVDGTPVAAVGLD